MTGNRPAFRLVGETLRDVGILVLVFGPLDAYFQQASRQMAGVAISLAAVGLCLIVAGIILETRSEEER